MRTRPSTGTRAPDLARAGPRSIARAHPPRNDTAPQKTFLRPGRGGGHVPADGPNSFIRVQAGRRNRKPGVASSTLIARADRFPVGDGFLATAGARGRPPLNQVQLKPLASKIQHSARHRASLQSAEILAWPDSRGVNRTSAILAAQPPEADISIAPPISIPTPATAIIKVRIVNRAPGGRMGKTSC